MTYTIPHNEADTVEWCPQCQDIVEVFASWYTIGVLSRKFARWCCRPTGHFVKMVTVPLDKS